MQTDWEWDWTTRRSWKSSWKDCFLFKTLKKKYNPKLERINKVTSLPEHHWYHLQSISDISEVRCLHRAQTKRQHPPSHSLFTLLPSDNRYTSSCCQTTTTSSFTPKTLWLMYKPVLQNRKWIKEDCFFFFFSFTSYKLLLSYFKSGFNELPAASVSKLHVGAVPTDIMSSEFAALLSLTNTI